MKPIEDQIRAVEAEWRSAVEALFAAGAGDGESFGHWLEHLAERADHPERRVLAPHERDILTAYRKLKQLMERKR